MWTLTYIMLETDGTDVIFLNERGWMKHKLESRFPGEISITSDTQIIPPLWQKAKRN